jgi:DNA-binding FrmR family transcriptional regulator
MDQNIKKKAARRLKIIAGQIRGLEKAIESDAYCIDIINQSLAAKQALSGVEDLVLENHLSTHVAHQVQKGEIKKVKDEILSIYKLSKRK